MRADRGPQNTNELTFHVNQILNHFIRSSHCFRARLKGTLRFNHFDKFRRLSRNHQESTLVHQNRCENRRSSLENRKMLANF